MNNKLCRIAWIWDQDYSFGINGPKLVLNIPFSDLDRAIDLFSSNNDMSFLNKGLVKLYGINKLNIKVSKENKFISNRLLIDVYLNNEGLSRLIEELKLLKKQGSISFFDLDDEGLANIWCDFLISTSEDLYKGINKK